MLRLFLILFCFLSPWVASSETLVWDMKPLHLDLPVGEEVLISFKKKTALQIPADILDMVDYTLLEDQYYYLKAKKSFKSTRIFAVTNASEEIIIDLSASNNAPADDIFILTKADAKLISPEETEFPHALATTSKAKSLNDLYIELTRFAMQQLYSPSRILQANPDLSRVRIKSQSAHLLRGQPEIKARPVAQWLSQSTGLFVTAVQIINTGNYRLALDPRSIRGNFLASTLQHGYLGQMDTPESISTVYLISSSSFDEAVGPWAIN